MSLTATEDNDESAGEDEVCSSEHYERCIFAQVVEAVAGEVDVESV